jgi:transposase
MFHGCIVNRKKGPCLFWEKSWGTINSTKYDEKILSIIEQFFRDHVLDGYIFWQDNAPSYRSYETKLNILRRRIPSIKVPLYSVDLNLIEHVWN